MAPEVRGRELSCASPFLFSILVASSRVPSHGACHLPAGLAARGQGGHLVGTALPHRRLGKAGRAGALELCHVAGVDQGPGEGRWDPKRAVNGPYI